MAEWISQAEEKMCSATSRTIARTRFLRPIKEELIGVIDAYFEEDPDGEEVVLACLKSLGKSRLEALGKPTNTGLPSMKQDIGLYIPILLVERFGKDGIETYRDPKTRRNSTRSPGRAWPDFYDKTGKSWVSRYTPHRLTARGKARLTELLETS